MNDARGVLAAWAVAGALIAAFAAMAPLFDAPADGPVRGVEIGVRGAPVYIHELDDGALERDLPLVERDFWAESYGEVPSAAIESEPTTQPAATPDVEGSSQWTCQEPVTVDAV
ncbi:MAG TPA: hypothetical protein VJ924_01210 [Alphaproteobacteria bacterium]|nr:hypothetical protein [Alphaproteobacteria bacterium]